MNINEIIKNAVHDRDLRLSLLDNPIGTCKKYGIDLHSMVTDNTKMTSIIDRSIMQGGYRP